MTNNDFESAWSDFKTQLLPILHHHAPMKVFSTKEDCQPWICTEFLGAANERDELQDKAKRTDSVCYKLLANKARTPMVSFK